MERDPVPKLGATSPAIRRIPSGFRPTLGGPRRTCGMRPPRPQNSGHHPLLPGTRHASLSGRPEANLIHVPDVTSTDLPGTHAQGHNLTSGDKTKSIRSAGCNLRGAEVGVTMAKTP